MKKFEEELARIKENNRYEVDKKLNYILSRVSDCEAKLQYLSEKIDDHISIQSSITENIFTSIFILEGKLREHGDGDGDGDEEGDDANSASLMKKIPSERQFYILKKVNEMVLSDKKIDRHYLMTEVLHSGKSNSDELNYIFVFVNESGELTEKGIKKRDEITREFDGPGFEIS